MPAQPGVLIALARSLAEQFVLTVDENDRLGRFPLENFNAIRESGLTLAGLPVELGGWGASVAEIGRSLRILATGCPSTALGMVQHHITVLVLGDLVLRGDWDGAEFLQDLALNRKLIGAMGGLPEFEGRGPRSATPIAGGWRFNGRVGWGTMTLAADYGTLAVTAEIDGQPMAVSGIIDLKAPGAEWQDNWDTIGMRPSGSQDIVFRDTVVPDSHIYHVRPEAIRLGPDPYNPNFVAFSYGMFLMMSLYLGIADAARAILIDTLHDRKRDGTETPLAADPRIQILVGEAELLWRAAGGLLDGMIARHPTFAGWGAAGHLDAVTTKDFVAQSAVRYVEQAFQILGGVAFYRRTGLERLYRDIRAATIHPLNHLATIDLLGKEAMSRKT